MGKCDPFQGTKTRTVLVIDFPARARVHIPVDSGYQGPVPGRPAERAPGGVGDGVFGITGIDTWPVAPRLLEDVYSAVQLSDPDPYTKNTLRDHDRVCLRAAAADVNGGLVTVTLAPASWTAVSLGL